MVVSLLAGIFSLAGAAYHASASLYRWALAGMAGAAWFSAHRRGEDLRETREQAAWRAHVRRARAHYRLAGQRWHQFGETVSESVGGYFHSLRIGMAHTWQALRGVPRSQWQPAPEPIRLSNAFNPLGLGLSIGFMLMAGHAAARRAEEEGRNPRWAAAEGALASGLSMLAQQLVFGSSLVGGAIGFGAYLAFYGGPEVLTAIKHGGRYRQSYVRAAAAPWSFSSEPSDVAYQMMLMATRNATGYEMSLGMEAAPMAARYSR